MILMALTMLFLCWVFAPDAMAFALIYSLSILLGEAFARRRS